MMEYQSVPTAGRTCLVTGACGFLGAALVGEFASAGYRVVGLGREGANGPQAMPPGLSTYEQMDLPSRALEGFLSRQHPHVIVHAAGPASVAASVADPFADFVGSIVPLYSLLDAVRTHSPDSRLVILSSAAVYGNPRSLPVAEEADPRPMSPYGFHKQFAEAALEEFARLYGVQCCAARVFSAYGAGLRRQIFWDLCAKAVTDDVVRLSGTGDETRDFIHASDVASAVRILAEKAGMDGDVYNVASGEETAIRDLAQRLVDRVSPGRAIEFTGDARPGDPLRWRADIRKIANLGFVPRVSLNSGVAEYTSWFLEEGERS